MSMSVGSREAPMCDINTTPLIDVMLVLLVMLIVTLPIMTHAVKLDMPQAEQPAAAGCHRPRSSTLRSTSTARSSGTAPRSRAFRRWSRTSGTESDKEPQPEIHLRPDRRAKYDVVANVLASAQRNQHEEDRASSTSRSSATSRARMR